MKQVKLKPSCEKLKVFNPATGLHLKMSGEVISLTKYWRRLIISGDVVEAENTKEVIKEVKEEKKPVKKQSNKKQEE